MFNNRKKIEIGSKIFFESFSGFINDFFIAFMPQALFEDLTFSLKGFVVKLFTIH